MSAPSRPTAVVLPALVTALTTAALVAGSSPAGAAWPTAGSGALTGRASALPAAPVLSLSTTACSLGTATLHLSWPAVAGATSYTVSRWTLLGVLVLSTTTTSTSSTATAQTATPVRFSVTASTGTWSSGPSATVTSPSSC